MIGLQKFGFDPLVAWGEIDSGHSYIVMNKYGPNLLQVLDE
jgi:hypothetical protein